MLLPRSNVAFPEMSFWSADVINNASVKTNQLKVDLDVQSLNRKYDRTEYFDIEAALTVDFMGKFIEFVQGDLIKITLQLERCM